MSFNAYLGPLVEMYGATSISTVLLVDVEVESFPVYVYVLTHGQITPQLPKESPWFGNP